MPGGSAMKPDKKGRSQTTRFARLDHGLLTSPAYRSLSPNARSLLIELAMMENSKNNGELFLSVRDAADRMGIADHHAVTKAFDELEGMGFIACTKDAHFAVKAGSGSRARCWRITWQSTPSLRLAPTHEYQTRRAEPGTRANKRMAAGCDALKRYAKEQAKNNLPVVDSTTLPRERVADSTTMKVEEQAETPVSVVDSTTRFSGNGGKASKPVVVDSTTHTALPAITAAARAAAGHSKARAADCYSTPSRSQCDDPQPIGSVLSALMGGNRIAGATS